MDFTTTLVDRAAVLKAWSVFKANIIVFILGSIVLRFFYRRHVSPLRKYPGPFFASGSRLWKARSTWTGYTELDHITLHKRYGPIVRVAPNQLSFASAAAAREVYGPRGGFTKTQFYNAFPSPGSPQLFTELRPDAHARQVRAAVPAFSLPSMQALTPWIEQTITQLTEKLDGFAGTAQPFDFPKWLHYFAFDLLGEIGFSRPFGFLSEGRDIDNTIATINKSQAYNVVVGEIPWLDKFLRRNIFWEYIPYVATKDSHISNIVKGAIESRQKGVPTDRKDLLGSFLDAAEKSGSKFTHAAAFVNAFGAIFAGSDSTTATMLRFLHLVHVHREAHAKVIAEIDQAQADGKLSDMVTYQEAQNLQYFQACMKESMRYGPAYGISLPRKVPSGGATVCGEILKDGTEVCLNAWVLHRDQETFGPDAELFRPERWLESSEEQVKLMERSLFHFGGGTRICSGRHLALLEINKLLPHLLRRYNFTLAKPGQLTHHSCGFFIIDWDMPVQLTLRKQL